MSPLSGSDAIPLSVTTVPTLPVRSAPALAVGARLGAGETVIVTVSGGLFVVPSLTMSWTTYLPAWVAVKVGREAPELVSVAVLPGGTLVNVQLYTRVSLFASLEVLPSRVTVVPTLTV